MFFYRFCLFETCFTEHYFFVYKSVKVESGELRAVRPHIYNIMFPHILVHIFLKTFSVFPFQGKTIDLSLLLLRLETFLTAQDLRSTGGVVVELLNGVLVFCSIYSARYKRTKRADFQTVFCRLNPKFSSAEGCSYVWMKFSD